LKQCFSLGQLLTDHKEVLPLYIAIPVGGIFRFFKQKELQKEEKFVKHV